MLEIYELYVLSEYRRYSQCEDVVYNNTKVVGAYSEEDARLVAYENAEDEGGDIWLDMTKTSCTLIDTANISRQQYGGIY